ncbi:histidine phosphatase family protein [Actinomycetospora endophytica]|uniref:Histidine phosphatase family protein n=1 Tax=Actinomycetospora endophytica TaxID=2291215 RepID=A0ABS8P2Z4_9PSEU|nr:histidine phosphatase family protein [Actinomycetospora endophytica]MCD2192606.1 histidine phosphatase family protein [Actinomycetospora endophytica]
MTRRRIYLMRHAEVSYVTDAGPVPDTDAVMLTQRGREQASAAGRALHDVAIDRVVTSGIPRTTATAALVLAEMPGTSPPVEEWPDLGEAHAGTPADISAELADSLMVTFSGAVGRDASYLGGETVGSLADRVNPVMDRVLADEAWDCALLVLHGAVNRVILSRALVGEGVFLGHLEQSPACINVLDHGPGPNWCVRAVNVTPYEVVPTGSRQTSVERIVERAAALRVGPRGSAG